MSRGLILCGSSDQKFSDFEFIATTNICLKLNLEKQGIAAEDLWGINIQTDAIAALNRIDEGLHLEAESRSEMRWAPLALVRVVRRYLHYLQYRLRLQTWLKDKRFSELVLSSGEDMDLVAAVTDVAKEYGLKLSILNGEFDIYSGLDPFMYNEVLPESTSIDNPLLTYIIAKASRYIGICTMYEPYTNLPAYRSGVTTFKWWKTIALVSSLKNKASILLAGKNAQRIVDPLSLTSKAYEDNIFTLNRDYWNNFDMHELAVINSALREFFKEHKPLNIDKLMTALELFFTISRLKRLVIMDSQIAHCRLLAYSARASNVFVDYLPHGIVAEDQTTSTKSAFSPHRVLAWNEAARRRFSSRGLSSIAISHPRNIIDTLEVKDFSLPAPDKMKCLVLFSCNDSISLDALERDFIDIYEALMKLGISAHWKLHNAGFALHQARISVINKVMEALNISIYLLDPTFDTLKIAKNYDLIIIGRLTSAIYEMAQLRIPFIVYKGAVERIGALDGVDISKAGSSKELVEAIKSFDEKSFFAMCERMNSSLICNMDPLAVE